jgi:peroxiredoxin
MKRFISAIAFTVLLTVGTCAQHSIKIGSAAPAFSGTTIDGSPVDLRSLEGKVVVMTFWSTRCLICHSEMPKLNAMTTRFDPSKVVFLALSMENEEKIAGYLKKNPIRSQVVPNSFGAVLQYADRDRNGNLDMGFPAYFVIDQKGLLKHRSSGYDKTVAIETVIAKLASQ